MYNLIWLFPYSYLKHIGCLCWPHFDIVRKQLSLFVSSGHAEEHSGRAPWQAAAAAGSDRAGVAGREAEWAETFGWTALWDPAASAQQQRPGPQQGHTPFLSQTHFKELLSKTTVCLAPSAYSADRQEEPETLTFETSLKVISAFSLTWNSIYWEQYYLLHISILESTFTYNADPYSFPAEK